MRHLYFVIFLFALSIIIFHNIVYAQECKQLCVAKQFYEQGETIVISGQVDVFLEKTPIIIQIFFGQNLVEIAQVDVAQDGSFTHTVIADGIYFQNSGKYTIRATYGLTENVYETSFDFQTKKSAGTTTEIFEVKAGESGTFDVPYTIRGGTVKNIVVDQNILGLIVTIESDSDGSLTLDLGRKWIDAKKSDGTDDSYIIFIDGLEVPYQETAVGLESRTLTIQFQEGDSDIEVIGTSVIPEFGSIALIVLVVAITSMVVISTKKTLLRFN
jgi:predicted secreted protein with PEFG-CTERM motif